MPRLPFRVCQNLKAPNDVNGNPRRLWFEYDVTISKDSAEARVVALHDEGYAGRPDACTVRAVDLPAIHISPGEYRKLKKEYKDRLAEA